MDKTVTQEWTPEIAAAIYGSGAYPFCKLADAHNAALAACREAGAETAALAMRLDELLAAERERNRVLALALSEKQRELLRARKAIVQKGTKETSPESIE
jgi:hypothetical protein